MIQAVQLAGTKTILAETGTIRADARCTYLEICLQIENNAGQFDSYYIGPNHAKILCSHVSENTLIRVSDHECVKPYILVLRKICQLLAIRAAFLVLHGQFKF